MKNSFKIGPLALAIAVSAVACKGKGGSFKLLILLKLLTQPKLLIQLKWLTLLRKTLAK